jgi:WD40 repeat protein
VRFWCLQDLPQKPLYTLETEHGEGDSLTALAVTSDARHIVTGDTSGNLKCWDVGKVDFWDKVDDNEKRENVWDIWFINAHKKIINSI